MCVCVSDVCVCVCVCVCRTVELPQGLLVRDGGAAAERSLGCVQHLSRLPHVSPGLSLCGERRLAWRAQRQHKPQTLNRVAWCAQREPRHEPGS